MPSNIDSRRPQPYNIYTWQREREDAPLNIDKKRDFLIDLLYWLVIFGAVYLGFEYLLPVSVPFIFGILIARLIVWFSRKTHCSHKLYRIGLSVLAYGILGLLIVLLGTKLISAITDIVKWLPDLYEYKLRPFVVQIYNFCFQRIQSMDPNLVNALEMVLESVLSSLKNLISYLSGTAVDLVSGIATGIPNLILSLLAMIFSTVFLVGDYEKIMAFLQNHIPGKAKGILGNVRAYLTDTLFVVIRSYLLIMTLTFIELSILFSVFGITSPVLKASCIAVLDILPILGTGGIMIPWAVISLVVGNVGLGLKLLLIYGIVTVVRNYVEPKIVGTQLGLHPIITLVSMFIGLRLFGFWGLFGLPVGISFFWKQRNA